MSIASKLAEYAISSFSNGVLPKPVTQITIQAIVDQYGLQIAGSEFNWSKSIYSYVTKYTTVAGHSSVTRYGDRTSPIQAAFINGCFAHAQDFDDSHQEAQTHPGSVVIPAAMAIGEHLDLPASEVYEIKPWASINYLNKL